MVYICSPWAAIKILLAEKNLTDRLFGKQRCLEIGNHVEGRTEQSAFVRWDDLPLKKCCAS